jgi:uncharacterized protein YaaR (DUF327 family)
MVSHEREFREFIADLESAERYVKFLHDISRTSGMDISPSSLRSQDDIESFASRLTQSYSPKSVSNYRSVMKKYVNMVCDLGL